MKVVHVGVIGFGTVGAGVVETLLTNGALISDRLGIHLNLKKVADLDIESDRGFKVPEGLLTTDAMSVVADPDIQVIVELVGGVGFAKEITLQALSLGKSVVTANKALLAECGEEIYAAVSRHRADLFYEASVGGGIPVIRSLREGLISNHIEAVYGILNGTCNYILTRMEEEGLPFDQVLDEAQKQGYAEADPGLDIDGLDTAHKAAILASLAYGFPVKMEDIKTEGIRAIRRHDIAFARKLGYSIKLLAIIKRRGGAVEVSVGPALVPEEHMLSSVKGVFNAVLIQGDIVGDTLCYGRGAGRGPTASAVVADIAEAARNVVTDSAYRIPAFVPHDHYEKCCDPADMRVRYYIRMTLKNETGVLAKVAELLGSNGISIASLIQNESTESGVFLPAVILTQMAEERSFEKALKEIAALDVVGEELVRIRIESCEV